MKKAKSRVQSVIPRKYFIASEDATGIFSWTLTSMLGHMLIMAEDLFGPRDTEYTLLGVEFTASGPRCWNLDGGKYVVIQLDLNALRDDNDACLQMAHECVHVLSPTGEKDANVLEEGLAVYFEKLYMRTNFGAGWWDGDVLSDNYRQAHAAATTLMLMDQDVIKKLRRLEPTISRITSDHIMTVCPLVARELADKLASPFYET